MFSSIESLIKRNQCLIDAIGGRSRRRIERHSLLRIKMSRRHAATLHRAASIIGGATFALDVCVLSIRNLKDTGKTYCSVGRCEILCCAPSSCSQFLIGFVCCVCVYICVCVSVCVYVFSCEFLDGSKRDGGKTTPIDTTRESEVPRMVFRVLVQDTIYDSVHICVYNKRTLGCAWCSFCWLFFSSSVAKL